MPHSATYTKLFVPHFVVSGGLSPVVANLNLGVTSQLHSMTCPANSSKRVVALLHQLQHYGVWKRRFGPGTPMDQRCDHLIIDPIAFDQNGEQRSNDPNAPSPMMPFADC